MNESDSIALPFIPLRRFLSRQPRAWRKSHGSAPMRRKFFRLWITFVLTGPRGTPSLSHESLIERPSPSETRTCTSHEKMTRRRDRRRATETDGGIRYEVSFLCLPGVDITRTVINTRNTTMITRSYRAYGMLRCTGCLIPHARLTRSWTFLMYRAATGSLLRSIVQRQSPHTRLWLDRPLPRYVSDMPRALPLERHKKKGSAGKSYPAWGSPIFQRGSVLLYSNRLRLNERHRSQRFMASRFLVLAASATASSQFQRRRGDSQLLVSSKSGLFINLVDRLRRKKDA